MSDAQVCFKCNFENALGAIFCSQCGTKLKHNQENTSELLTESMQSCPVCRKEGPYSAKGCTNCGHPLKKPESILIQVNNQQNSNNGCSEGCTGCGCWMMIIVTIIIVMLIQ